MSYILEALKKSDAERKQGEDTAQHHAEFEASPISSPPRKPWAGMIAGGFMIVAVLGLGAAFMMQDTSAPPVAAPAPETKSKPIVEAPKIAKAEPVEAPKPEPKPVPVPEPKPASKPEPEPEPKSVLKAKPVSTPTLPALASAKAYVDRAWGSLEGGLYGQAIADLDLALKIEPAYSEAWFAHGWANEKNGDEKAAIKDYNRAIDAKPNHAFALFSRGFLNLYHDNPQAAVVDFVRTQGVATDESLRLYSRLWLYLGRERAGQNGRARLKDDALNETLRFWPGPLVQFFSGTLGEKDVLKAIETSTDEHRKERRATGYFFLGIAEQLRGNDHNARAYFEKTLATGAVEFRQYDAARRELERLNR